MMVGMSILMKISYGICAVLMVAGLICVITVALFPPREYRGDGKTPRDEDWDESIEDV